MENRTYVVGHVNPDTDSIASALGYAWLLQERDGTEAIAARAGAINPQTTWVLNRLEMKPPQLLTDASPRFESVTRRLDTASPDSPLQEAWAIANRTGGVAPVVNPDGTPYGLITGLTLLSQKSWMFPVTRQLIPAFSDSSPTAESAIHWLVFFERSATISW
jgi:manganese-dependent inorganic pyrophosphatase